MDASAVDLSTTSEPNAVADNRSGKPLCIDLDGTLTYADLSVESLIGAVKRQPWLLFILPFWFLQGKAMLKQKLAARSMPDVTVLPYNEQLLGDIQRAKAAGRRVVLVTGSDTRVAEAVAEHLGVFDEVIGSDGERNLTSRNKAGVLVARFGQNEFDYAGNESADVPVWQVADGALVVNANDKVTQQAEKIGRVVTKIPPRSAGVMEWLRAIRVHQWSKNALLFLPLFTSHRFLEFQPMLSALLGFLAFSAIASATYIINDLLDLDTDRHHAKKHKRSFASCMLSVKSGVVMCAALFVVGIALALAISPAFLAMLGLYVVTTLAYSFGLKRVASLDVMVLAGLYTLRIIAGGVAAGVTLSFWLLAFSMFIFLCLAFTKRVAELVDLRERAEAGAAKVRGREYSTADISLLQTMGTVAGYLSVLVLALYINSPDVLVLYATPQMLWLVAPLLLLWVTRLWVVTSRGYMHDDPIVFAIKDPETWVTVALVGVIVLSAKAFDLTGLIG